MQMKPAFASPSDGIPEVDFETALVEFHHPAYPELNPPLLHLYALDEDQDGNHGLDYDTAFIACAVIANNAFDTGRLAIKSGGVFINVPRPANNLLRENKYYFCVGDQNPSTNKYPVVPSFDHWRFPHTLPGPWKNLRIDSFKPLVDFPGESPAELARYRDGTCRISGHQNSLEAARLVPIADGHWFGANGMGRYCYGGIPTQDIAGDRNVLLLRTDLRRLLDSRRLTFVAKFASNSATSATTSSLPADPLAPATTTASTTATAVLTLHTLIPNLSGDLVHLYHNRQLQQPIRGLAPEFLFARFAWSLFAREIYPFYTGFTLYNVVLYNPDKMWMEEDSLPGHGIRAKNRVFPAYRIAGSKRPRDEDDDVDPRPPRGARSPTAAEVERKLRRQLYGGGAVSSDEEDRRGRTMKRKFEDFESPSPGSGTPSEASM